MNYLRNGCVLFVLIISVSCSKDDLGRNRDVAYYQECRNERDRVIEICKNDPGKYQLHPNCVNAYRARPITGDSDAPRCLIKPPLNLMKMTQEEIEADTAEKRAICDKKYEEYIKSRKC